MSTAAVHALDLLRAEGRRVTTARRTIIELLGAADEHLTSDDHLTADDIAQRVHFAHPEIHVSTVYRTLESLEAWGLVEHVHRGHGASFFHLAASHPHVVCEECGRVFDVPAYEFSALVARVREAYGFELDIAHNALMGTCSQHRATGTSPVEVQAS
jgi:Fur family ferric uptake transcriptional regulator